MYPQPSASHSISSSKIATGALLFSLGLGLGTAGWYLYNQTHNRKKAQVKQKLIEALTPEYGGITEKIIAIYHAAGLGPLLEQKLMYAKPHETISILNELLQEIILRPRTLDRYELNDSAYLKTVNEKLSTAYQKAGLCELPLQIDASQLRKLLLDPTLWQDEIENGSFNTPPTIDTVALFGEAYQGYLDRQTYFFKLETEQKIRLTADSTGYCSVYLLGGNRLLNPLIDAPILALQNAAITNEQEMMDHMFSVAMDNRATDRSLTPLSSISTNSPQQAGYRPTTASTLQSFIQLAHLKDVELSKCILLLSSAPFIRYQRLVTKRILQAEGISADIQYIVLGPSLANQLETHPQFAQTALIANCLDTLAREIYETHQIHQIHQIQSYNNQLSAFKKLVTSSSHKKLNSNS